jgi:hypothetical protein
MMEVMTREQFTRSGFLRLGLAGLAALPVVGLAAAQSRAMQTRDPFGGPPPGSIDRGRGMRRVPESALAKEDFKNNLRDVEELTKLVQDLKEDLNSDGPFVIDVNNIKAVERIEKLAKDIKGRLKRY